ncbi:MAG: hypothetical protein WCI36_00780 [bacterium]
MNNLQKLVAKYEDYKLSILIKEIEDTEKENLSKSKEKTKYISPRSLFLGTQTNTEKIFIILEQKEYSPV